MNSQNICAWLDVFAKLVRQHDCQRLVAGNHTCYYRRNKNAREREKFFTEFKQEILQAVQKARCFENARVTTRQADDSYYVRHRNYSAAA